MYGFYVLFSFGVIKQVYMDMACFDLPKNHTFGLELAS